MHKKTWSQPDARSTIRRLSHCPSCRNEQCWKPHVAVYIIPPPYQRAYCAKLKRAVYDTPCRASTLLCSWLLNWNLRDSRIVKTKAYSYALICICRPDLLPSCGLSARVTVAKIVIISEYCIKKERNFLKMLWVDVWLAVKLWLLPLCLYKNKKLFQQLQLPLLKTILRCFCKMAWHLYCSNRTNIQRARHQYISLYCS